jgi:ABC-type amino acid transport substrate-binding protein
MRISRIFLTLSLIGVMTFVLTISGLGQFKPVLEKVKDTGVLKVGCREAAPPFAYVDEKGDMVGFSQDMAFLLAKKMEERVGREVEVKQIPFAGASRILVVQNGSIDIEMGSSTHNGPREDVLDFSLPYFISETVFAVRTGEGIDSLDDCNGKIVGTMRATTNLLALEKIIEEGVINPSNLVVVETHARGLVALETKKVDAYFTDTSLLMGLITRAKNPENYEIVYESIHAEPYGWMMREGDSDFRDFVNHFLIWTLQTKCSAELDTLTELGIMDECKDPNFTIFDAIYDKWMGPDSVTPTPRGPAFNNLLTGIQWPDISAVWPKKQ